MKGMVVKILRAVDFPDCSKNGITAQHAELTLVGEDVPEIFEPTEDRPAVVLKSARFVGTRIHLFAEPVPDPDNPLAMYCFGGNFIYSSDSRFPSEYPIGVHDRDMG